MVNKVILLGNLGKDPELITTNTDTKICKFSMATSEKYKGEEKTEWHNIVMFGRQAEIANDYLKKGSKAYIEGKIQTRKWEDKNGNNRYTTEIIGMFMKLLDSKKQEEKKTEDMWQDDPFS